MNNELQAEEFESKVRRMVLEAPNNTKPLFHIWIPITDTQEGGIWLDFYDGAKSEVNLPDAEQMNCGAIRLSSPHRLLAWFCSTPEAHSVKCVCQHPRIIYLTLRGLCPFSAIDKYYMPYNDKATADFLLLGLKSTLASYNQVTSAWDMKVFGTTYNTTASCKIPKISYLLGKHEWEFENDDKRCSIRGEPYTKLVKLTGCKVDEFTCNDGQCISMNRRCDQISNCRDFSDESNCDLLVLKRGYNKKVAPFTVDFATDIVYPANVKVSIDLMDVIGISEQEHKITFKFGISMSWFEHRANYNNLKRKINFNALSNEEMMMIWTPFLVYENTDNNEVVKISEQL